MSTGIKPRHRGLKTALRIFLVLLSLVIVTAVYFGIKIYLVERNIFKGGGSAVGLSKKVDITKLKGEGDGRVNILMLGIGSVSCFVMMLLSAVLLPGRAYPCFVDWYKKTP